MQKVLIARDNMHDKIRTKGIMHVEGQQFFTIECPWIPTAPGGKPRSSCVPAGQYLVEKFIRPDGREAFILSNPGLGVFKFPQDRENGIGRSLILIHPGNYVNHVIGCIAIGKTWNDSRGGMVTHSQSAMKQFQSLIKEDKFLLQITGTNLPGERQ